MTADRTATAVGDWAGTLRSRQTESKERGRKEERKIEGESKAGEAEAVLAPRQMLISRDERAAQQANTTVVTLATAEWAQDVMHHLCIKEHKFQHRGIFAQPNSIHFPRIQYTRCRSVYEHVCVCACVCASVFGRGGWGRHWGVDCQETLSMACRFFFIALVKH